jgi:hypothetical protein
MSHIGNGNCPLNQEYEENEDPNSYECMNLVEDLDPIYTIPRETYTITSEQMELIKQKSVMLLG